jgi:RNA-dependent RNA polymerase
MTTDKTKFWCDRAMDWRTEMQKTRQQDPDSGSNIRFLQRQENLGAFIMDQLMKHAEKQAERTRKEIYKIFDCASATASLDQDLAQPYLIASARAERSGRGQTSGTDATQPSRKEELDSICNHVRAMRQRHREIAREGQTSNSKHITYRQDILRKLSSEFWSTPPRGELFEHHSDLEMNAIQASYAYVYDWEQTKSHPERCTRFPWDVGFRELCNIKCRATGQEKSVAPHFYSKMYLRL